MDLRHHMTHVLLGLVLAAVCSCSAGGRVSDEERLMSHLFSGGYHPSARPVLNSSHTVHVNIQFSLLQIQELNVRSQLLTTTGVIILEWHDARLTWDDSVSTQDEVVVDANNIWRPEFAVINGADGLYEQYSQFQAVVSRSGGVRWEPGGVFRTRCPIDITYYPFDTQRCDLRFGAWSYYTTKMNLSSNSVRVNLDKYEASGEWTLERTSVTRREFNFACCPDQRFANVAFTLRVRRKSTFYVMNVIVPGLLTSAVLLSIFYCAPAQKVHIGVAALLSFRLYLLNVADTVPRTSDHVPLLGVYLTSTLAITTLVIVSTVFVLNVHGVRGRPVPAWLDRLLLNRARRLPPALLCLCGGPQSTAPRPWRRDTPPPASSSPGVGAVRGVDHGGQWARVAAVCDRAAFCLCLLLIVATTAALFYPLTPLYTPGHQL